MGSWWKGASATSCAEIKFVALLARAPDSPVDFHAGDELPEALITAVDVHQFDWRACVDGLVQADTDDDEA